MTRPTFDKRWASSASISFATLLCVFFVDEVPGEDVGLVEVESLCVVPRFLDVPC